MYPFLLSLVAAGRIRYEQDLSLVPSFWAKNHGIPIEEIRAMHHHEQDFMLAMSSVYGGNWWHIFCSPTQDFYDVRWQDVLTIHNRAMATGTVELYGQTMPISITIIYEHATTTSQAIVLKFEDRTARLESVMHQYVLKEESYQISVQRARIHHWYEFMSALMSMMWIKPSIIRSEDRIHGLAVMTADRMHDHVHEQSEWYAQVRSALEDNDPRELVHTLLDAGWETCYLSDLLVLDDYKDGVCFMTYTPTGRKVEICFEATLPNNADMFMVIRNPETQQDYAFPLFSLNASDYVLTALHDLHIFN